MSVSSKSRSHGGGDSQAAEPRAEEFLNAREVAAALKVSQRHVWTLTHSGALPYFRVGRAVRFRRSDLELFAAQRIETQATRPGTAANG